MDQTSFKQTIRTAMGGNLVDVELTDADYTFAFNNAKRKFIQYGNANTLEQYISVTQVIGQQTYQLSTSPAQIDTIIDVIRAGAGFYTTDPFSIATFNELFQGLFLGYSIDLLTIEESYELIKTLKYYTVDNPAFIWNKRTQTLQFLKTPQTTDVIFLHCYCYDSDDNLRDLLWVQNWAIAEAKVLLGTAYQKFSQVSGPSGEVTLSGAALIEDGRGMMTALLEEVADYVDGDPAGGFICIG